MTDKIKLKLEGGEHSTGRGVGFYRNNLASSLKESGKVELVDSDPDLIHYPFFDLFYPTLPDSLSVPTVVTIHDVTPLVFPKLYPLGFRAKFALHRQKQALKNVKAVLTDSYSSKRDLVSYLNLPSEKVFVTHLAVSPIYTTKPSEEFLKSVKAKYALPDEFVLYVGGINPNKNLLRLATACLNLKLPLVLVGSEFTKEPVKTFSLKKLLGLQSTHPELRQFQKLSALIRGNPLFITPGFVPDEDLNAVYRLANLYCQPSLYEGFGLPLLEAMTAGCLVISSIAGSLPEIYSSETTTFTPESQTEIEAALKKALHLTPKQKEKLIDLNKEKSKEFSWSVTAANTLKIYRSVLQ